MNFDPLDGFVRANRARAEITPARIERVAANTLDKLTDATPFGLMIQVSSFRDALVRLLMPMAVSAALGVFVGLSYSTEALQSVSIASLINTSILDTAGY